MSEENTEVVHQESEVEQQARQHGWKPKDEAVAAGLDASDAVDAKTFLDRGPFIKQIKLLEQRNASMASKIDTMLQRWNDAETKGYERAIAELEQRRDEAFDALDSAQVRQIDKEIQNQQKAKEEFERSTQQMNNPNQLHPEAAAFVDRNADWWNDSSYEAMAAKTFAANTEGTLKQMNPGMDPVALYREVQKRVDAFRGVKPSKDKVSYVSPPTRGSSSSSSEVDHSRYGFNDLNSEAKDVYMSIKNYKKSTFNKDYSVKDFIESQTTVSGLKLEEIVRQ